MISITRDGDNKLANKQLQDLLASANRQEPKNADLFHRLVRGTRAGAPWALTCGTLSAVAGDRSVHRVNINTSSA